MVDHTTALSFETFFARTSHLMKSSMMLNDFPLLPPFQVEVGIKENAKGYIKGTLLFMKMSPSHPFIIHSIIIFGKQ